MNIFHFHKWKLLGVDNGEVFEVYFVGGYLDGRFVKATQLKEICQKCGKTRLRTIKGYWTLEELL